MTFLYDSLADLPQGQVAEISTDPKNNVTAKISDQAGRILSVTSGGQTTNYTYYDNGSKHMTIYPDGFSEEYAYYDNGWLRTLTNKKADQTVIDAYTYTYDAAGNMISKTDGKGTTTYTYDPLNRLETVTEPSSKITGYTFDGAGNRLTQTETYQGSTILDVYTYNTQNRLTGLVTALNGVTAKTVSYAYDHNGNQLNVSTTAYQNGIAGTTETMTNTFDSLNRLIGTGMPDGTNVTNAYNGEGFRVRKDVNGQVAKYVYEGDKIVLELDGLGNQIARNLYGTNLISRTVQGTTLYYMYNGHADVTALIDATGTIQATYYYDAFGNILEQMGNVNNNITYSGYQYDKETGMYYLQSRYYDPIIARFLSEDSYWGDQNDPLSLNLYTYCHNEPLMYFDPSGRWKQTIVNGRVYETAEPGDTLWSLANYYTGWGGNWKELNYSGDPNTMSVGTKIDVTKYRPQNGSSSSSTGSSNTSSKPSNNVNSNSNSNSSSKTNSNSSGKTNSSTNNNSSNSGSSAGPGGTTAVGLGTITKELFKNTVTESVNEALERKINALPKASTVADVLKVTKRTVPVVSVAIDVIDDYQSYQGNNFYKAAAVAVGAVVGGVTAALGGSLVTGIVVGTLVGLTGNYIKRTFFK
ncbi:RHS repeat-associated core domain protein [Syntrophobotulus glycolicus DSM 8271]|uniref:RHS repeat-associated core domain protein n=1 Tax=Syntrophobotulus glycolicus (strain DSM 8271 / FlGlyR) TaxID=645991 RepID=F0T2N1_SYNGF|nr:RHS repeat-associated core domain-containing protein [Syntrophobotulus glycolicus]ADY56430.1 RHS repeat-associated core domain protein [Syntrophobotulus glycolicus DSM 8271]